MSVVAIAPSNIALVKYWGKRDAARQWPANDSLSMTLTAARTETRATIVDSGEDELVYGGKLLTPESKEAARVMRHLDLLRRETGASAHLRIETQNTFPSAAGIASSASGFAALTLAGTAALLEAPDLAQLADRGFTRSRLASLARLGSGSACRSLFGGYVLWEAGTAPERQDVRPILAPEAFPLADLIVVLQAEEKRVSSSEAHRHAWTSPLFGPRLAGLPERLKRIEAALAAGDFERLGIEIEHEALEMHAVIMTAEPPVRYLETATVELCAWLREERARGSFEAYFTIDAGPNVHVLCRPRDAAAVSAKIQARFGAGVRSILQDQIGEGVSLASHPVEDLPS